MAPTVAVPITNDIQQKETAIIQEAHHVQDIPTSAQSMVFRSNNTNDHDKDTTVCHLSGRTRPQECAFSSSSHLGNDTSTSRFLYSLKDDIATVKAEGLRHLSELETILQRKIAQLDGEQLVKIDSNIISEILNAEKELTGKKVPVKGGPTAQAQKHIGEIVSKENIHAVTEGEKHVSSNSGIAERGPTTILQEKLSKSQMDETK